MRVATVRDYGVIILAFVDGEPGIQIYAAPGTEDDSQTFVEQAERNPSMDVEEFIGSGWSYYQTEVQDVDEAEVDQIVEGLVPLTQG